jgi:hypothetical protein
MKLSPEAFKLFCLLLSYAKPPHGECWPSQKTLSEKMDRSVGTIHRLMDELSTNKLVKIKAHGKGRVNTYYVDIYA